MPVPGNYHAQCMVYLSCSHYIIIMIPEVPGQGYSIWDIINIGSLVCIAPGGFRAHSGEYGCPGWTADRRNRVGICEINTLAGQSVHIRCDGIGMSFQEPDPVSHVVYSNK